MHVRLTAGLLLADKLVKFVSGFKCHCTTCIDVTNGIRNVVAVGTKYMYKVRDLCAGT
jgi:hypothetical protein